ncbi:MAG: hypothetical protein IJQ07_05155 [Clostridia bacterium]|nr:hypothetical protein [Clostridia bacterium]
MKKKQKKVDLEKIHNGVKKASRITSIFFRLLWILVGVAALAAFIYAAVAIGQAFKADFGFLFGK